MKIKPQTWADIEIRYKGLKDEFKFKSSMLEFVAYIQNSEYCESLFPWTSMFKLKITQTANSPYDELVPYLQISPLNDGSAEFRYVDSNFTSNQWVRIADKGRFIERFESFIDQIGWRAKVL